MNHKKRTKQIAVLPHVDIYFLLCFENQISNLSRIICLKTILCDNIRKIRQQNKLE